MYGFTWFDVIDKVGSVVNGRLRRRGGSIRLSLAGS
jgi:hypothetical protein